MTLTQEHTATQAELATLRAEFNAQAQVLVVACLYSSILVCAVQIAYIIACYSSLDADETNGEPQFSHQISLSSGMIPFPCACCLLLLLLLLLLMVLVLSVLVSMLLVLVLL